MSEIIEIDQQVEKESTAVVTQAVQYAVIKTPEQFNMAGEFLKTIKSMQKKVSDTFDPIVQRAHATWKEVLSQKAKFFDPLDDAEKKIKSSMIRFSDEQEKIRLEAERKAQAEARAKEEAERKKLEEKAQKAEEKGNLEKAEELRNKKEEVFIPTPSIQSIVPKVSGIKTQKVWKARIVDFTKIPAEHLIVTDKQREAHQSYLNGVAKSMKGTIKISGVEFFEESAIASNSN